jgi:heterodisulfide reductase subunit A-like polyferredoxin
MNRNDPSSTRRAAMRALVAGAAIPAMAAARPTVGIIGGGMAGVAAAWLLDGMLDVTLLESEAVLGGNV